MYVQLMVSLFYHLAFVRRSKICEILRGKEESCSVLSVTDYVVWNVIFDCLRRLAAKAKTKKKNEMVLSPTIGDWWVG